MVDRVKDFFTGSVRFRVDGDFRVLNRFRKYGLKDVEIGGDFVCFSVSLRYVRELKRQLPKASTMENKNIFRVLNLFYMRWALSVCVVACIVALVVLGNFVFRIKVVGVEGAQRAQVEQFIAGQGFGTLMRKNQSRADVLVQDIIANFDFVAHASVRIVGNAVYFWIYAIEPPRNPTGNDDIVSAHDAVVTSVILASGRAMVMVGSVVHAGDVLIRGEFQTGVDADGNAIFTPVRAVGEVLGLVSHSEFGVGVTSDELLQRIVTRTGISAKDFDKVESFVGADGGLEVVASVIKSIVLRG